MSKALTRIERAGVDELYKKGGLDSLSQTAKHIHADPQAVGRYLKKRGYTTKFRKRARWIGLGTSILALASAGTIYFSVASSYPTLEDAKRTSNPEVVEKYLDRILDERVGLTASEVTYDPDFEKQIGFWKAYLTTHPEKSNYIQGQIQDSAREKANLDRFEAVGEKGGANLAGTAHGLDGKVVVFVHYIPDSIKSDDDVRWILYHERCHARSGTQYIVDMTTIEGTQEEIRNAVESVENDHDVEEAACYTFQFNGEREKRFAVGKEIYNAIVLGSRKNFEELKRKGSEENVRGKIIKQLNDSYFIDPFMLELKQNNAHSMK